jgi:hypothetical protein
VRWISVMIIVAVQWQTRGLSCHVKRNVFETEYINLILGIILRPTTLRREDLSYEVSK